jgi:hypothetical protein
MAVLLPYLDGTNDRGKLRLVLIEALSRGEVRVPEFRDGLETGGNTQLQSVSLQYIERALGYLARHALLEPS